MSEIGKESRIREFLQEDGKTLIVPMEFIRPERS